jgi:ADP-L-glycero-D-manno-heptose 6-epimerase
VVPVLLVATLLFIFQENFPKSTVIVFDCFRSTQIFANGNLKSFGHYKNLIGFKGRVICGNIYNQADLTLLAY